MAVTGCQGNGKKIRMFYKAAILSMKHYVHINPLRTKPEYTRSVKWLEKAGFP